MKYVTMDDPPVLGDKVASKKLKIIFKVIGIKDNKVVLSIEDDNSFFTKIAVLSMESTRTVTLDELTENYYLIEEKVSDMQFNGVKVTLDDLKNVKYKNGEVFISHDTMEKVSVSVVREKQGITFVTLISEDKLFDNKNIEYELPESEFLNNFYKESPFHYGHSLKQGVLTLAL